MKRTYVFTLYVTGKGETYDEAWDNAKKETKRFEYADAHSEMCEVCGWPVDIPNEDCMCDDARHGDKVSIVGDSVDFRWVFDEGKGEGNYETPESIRKLRDQGRVRFVNEQN